MISPSFTWLSTVSMVLCAFLCCQSLVSMDHMMAGIPIEPSTLRDAPSIYPPGGRMRTGDTPQTAWIFWLVEPTWLTIPSAPILVRYLWSWVWLATSHPWSTIRLMTPAFALTLEPSMKNVALPPLACRLSSIRLVTDVLGPSSNVRAIIGLDGSIPWETTGSAGIPAPLAVMEARMPSTLRPAPSCPADAPLAAQSVQAPF